MEKDNIIESLKKIKRVEPSPFLFTRIQAKIESDSEKSFSFDLFSKLAFCVALVLVAVNLAVVFAPSENDIVQIVDVELEATPDSLYYASIIQNFNFYENGSE